VVDGSRAWVAGASAVIVFDERPATRSDRAASGIAMHMLAQGDAFDLASRTASMAARGPLPQGPAADSATSAPTDSFTAWEWLRALDRFARTAEATVSFPGDSGEIVMRKTPVFRAAGTDGEGIRGATRGLAMTGVAIDVRRK